MKHWRKICGQNVLTRLSGFLGNGFSFLPSALLFFAGICIFSGCALMQNENENKKQTEMTVRKSGDGSSPTVRNRVVILPFLDAEPSRPEALRLKAREKFMKDLGRTRQMVVVDSEDLKVKAGDYLRSGDYEYGKLGPQMQTLGIPVLLEGKILSLKVRRQADEVGVLRQVKSTFELQVRLKMISSKSQKELLNLTRNVSMDETGVRVAENATVDSLMKSDPELLQRLVADAFLEMHEPIRRTLEKLAWEGRIASVNGEKIYLNVGEKTGLNPGDLLRVSEDGQDIYDPQTGQFIGRVAGRVKGTIEVVSFFGDDGAIAVLHSGSGFKENDRVELY